MPPTIHVAPTPSSRAWTKIDVTDRVGDVRLVVARNGALALVYLRMRAVIAEMVGIPPDARGSSAR
jgi:hypothetical protein